MTYTVNMPRGCEAGNTCDITFNIDKKMPFIATAGISLTVEFRNSLCGRHTVHDIYISGDSVSAEHKVSFATSMCGEEKMVCREAVCYDVFGICSVHIQPFPEQSMVLFPRQSMVRVLEKVSLAGAIVGDLADPGRKGNDAT